MPRHCVDMILCDLPYGHTANAWDRDISLPPLWKAYEKLARPDTAIVLTAVQPFAGRLVYSNLPAFKYEWIWVKNKSSGFLNAKNRPLRNHENILVFSYGKPPYNPIMLDGYSPIHGARHASMSSCYRKEKQHNRSVTEPGRTIRYPTSTLHFAVVNNDSAERIHPTQKPVALFQYLIETYTEKGDIVLDNCIGSGTAARAAIRAGRHFVGIDVSAEYCEGARKQIEQDRRQLTLL